LSLNRILLTLSILNTLFFICDIILFSLDIYAIGQSSHVIIGMYSLYLGELLLSFLSILLIMKKNFSFLTQTLYFLLPVVLLGGAYDAMRLYSVSRIVTYVIESILIILVLFLMRKLKYSK